jgi:hypothetical protein
VLPAGQFLPGSTRDIGGDDVGGMPVQTAPGTVVSHGGPGISMRGGFLHVPQRDPSVQRRGDERVPQRVRPDRLGDPGAARDSADDPPGAVPVQPTAIGGQEDRSFGALADGQVDRPRRPWRQRDSYHLAAFAGDNQHPVPAFDTQGFDIRAGGFGDPQPVQGQQRDERVLGRSAEPSSDQQRAKLVTVQPGGVGLVVQAGPSDMGGRE